MSRQIVKQFWHKVDNDQELQARLRANATGNKEKIFAGLVTVAADAGFEFSVQDYEAALEEEIARRHAATDLRPEHLSLLATQFEDSINSCTTTVCNCSNTNWCDG